MPKPRIVILAGPNGAGKTTASKYLLRDALGIGEFVNADAIAAGLSGFAPESVALPAGRIVLDRIYSLIDQRTNFAFETTLSGVTLRKHILRAIQSGFEVELFYLSLPKFELAVDRVASRRRIGEHTIPNIDIERRFFRSLRNLIEVYIPMVDRWCVFDNFTAPPMVIASGSHKQVRIEMEEKWNSLKAFAAMA